MRDRTKYIGGSDVGVIIGECKWKDAITLWEEKCGLREPEEPSLLMRVGSRLEPMILDAYFAEKPHLFEQSRNAFKQDAGVPYFGGEADAIFLDGQKKAIVDAKFNTRGEFDGGAPPKQYQAQAQWYCMIHDADYCDFATFHAASPDKIRVYRVERDNEIIAWLREMAHDFWLCVELRTPPRSTSVSEEARRLKWVNPPHRESVTATSEILQSVNAAKHCAQVAKEAEAEGEKHRTKIAQFIAGADFLIDECGQKIASFKNGGPRRTLRLF